MLCKTKAILLLFIISLSILSISVQAITEENQFQLTVIDSKNSSELSKQKYIPLNLKTTNTFNFFTLKECNTNEIAPLKLKIKITPTKQKTYQIKYQYFYIPTTENQCFTKPINISIISNSINYNIEQDMVELFKYNDLYYYINVVQ